MCKRFTNTLLLYNSLLNDATNINNAVEYRLRPVVEDMESMTRKHVENDAWMIVIRERKWRHQVQ